jgi:TBC1 domain family member 15
MRAQLLTLDHLVQLMDPALYLHLQSADSTNFFFFFRMLLVWYKREFEWADVLRLWESLWTDWLSSSFHLFVALAILEKHRDVIMKHLKHFDEVLKYSMWHFPQSTGSRYSSTPLDPPPRIPSLTTILVNELSNTIDLPSTLLRAQALFRRFQRTVDAIDKKRNFPAPPVRQRRLVRPETAGGSSTQPKGTISTGTETSRTARGKGKAEAEDGMVEAEEKVISSELRGLLSKTIIVVEKDGRGSEDRGSGIR